MAAPTITASTLFTLNVLPNTLTFNDTTDYAGVSISPSDVVGLLTITGPNGIFYSNNDYNSPDINPSVSTAFSRNLPLDANSAPLQGQYSFLYKIRVYEPFEIIDARNLAGTYSFFYSGNVVSSFPPGTIITVTDSPNAGTYTVSNSFYVSGSGNTTVQVVEAIVNYQAVAQSYIYGYYQQTFIYEFCYASPSVEVEMTYDCDCSKLISRDLTNYNISVCGGVVSPSSLARTLTLYAPAGGDGLPVQSPVITSLPSITVSPIWTNTWRSTASVVLQYTLPSGLIIQISVAGEENVTVSCSNGLCCVFECLSNLYVTYNTLLVSNPTQGQKYEALWQEAVGAWMLYSIAKSCGNTSAQKYLDRIIAIAKKANCDCCNESTQDVAKQIIPICGLPSAGTGGSGSVTVVTAGNGIEVTYSNTGGTNTYQVSIDEDVVNGIIQQYLIDNPLTFGSLSTSFLTALTTYVNGFISIYNIGGVTITNEETGQVLMSTGSGFTNQPLPVTHYKAYVLNAFTTPQSLSTSGAFTLMDQTMPLATGNNPLSEDGDTVEFVMIFSHAGANVDSLAAVALNGTPIAALLIPTAGVTQTVNIGGIITRISATSLLLTLTRVGYMENVAASLNAISDFQSTVTVADITGTPLQIAPYALINSDTVTCIYANYKSIKK